MILVDANVLLDVVTQDPVWLEWSQGELARREAEGLAINPIIDAELAPAFRLEEELWRHSGNGRWNGWRSLTMRPGRPHAPLRNTADAAGHAPRRCRIFTLARTQRRMG